jgi:hypothetical protein
MVLIGTPLESRDQSGILSFNFGYMFSINFRFAYRNLKRQKFYAFINIAGLAVSLAACWLIALYVSDELRFDRFNKKADRIVRVAQHARWDGAASTWHLPRHPLRRH